MSSNFRTRWRQASRRHRAGAAGCRNRAIDEPTNKRSHRVRPLPARLGIISFPTTKAGSIKPLHLLEESDQARDPGYGAALALAAYCHQQLQISGWAEDREANRRIANRSRSPGRPGLHRRSNRPRPGRPCPSDTLARASTLALALIDRALALNPSSAHAWYWSGYLRLYAGRPGLAIQHFNSSLRLSLRDPTRWRSLDRNWHR